MPKSVARKAPKPSKRRRVSKRSVKKSTKRSSKHHKRGGYSRKRKSSKKSPKRKLSKRKRSKRKSSKKMKGGASLYSFDLNDMIGGLPAVVRSLSCRGKQGSNLNK